METVLQAVRWRRSIRHYLNRAIEPEIVAELEEAVMRSPSSRGIRPCRFTFVRDRATLEALSRAKPQWSDFLAEAALGVVICADAELSDAWIEDCSVAGSTLMLVAADRGVGSCWIQIRDRQAPDGSSAEEYVRDVLSLDASVRVLCIISLGYPARSKPALPASRLQPDGVTHR